MIPAGGLGFVGVEVGDAALGAVEGDVDGVGIGGDVGVDGGVGRYPHLYAVQVILVAPVGIAACDPDAVVVMHGDDGGG